VNERDDEKSLSTERLPDPKSAAEELAAGGPRKRTADHLKRILRASLSLPLAAGLSSCKREVTPTTPQPAAAPRSVNNSATPPGNSSTINPPPPPPPPRGGTQALGFLNVTSTPIADIEIDGKPTGLKTPQTRIELTPGMHTVKLTSATPSLVETFTVQIRSGATQTEDRNLQPTANPGGQRQ
jgi:hypothetical protein